MEPPQCARPREFEGRQVPEVLFSGDHAKIARWRREKALEATLKHRPDLLKAAALDKKDLQYLAALQENQGEHKDRCIF